MILIIDTTPLESFSVALATSRGLLAARKTVPGYFLQSEQLLPTIINLLKNKKLKLESLIGVSVVSGPGGFTALRIGVVTANTLAYALKIPVVSFLAKDFLDYKQLASQSAKKIKANPKYKIVRPLYGQPPNITKSKKLPLGN